MSEQKLEVLKAQHGVSLVALFCFASVGAAIAIGNIFTLPYCVLCMKQRWAFGIVGGILLVFLSRPWGRQASASLFLLSALTSLYGFKLAAAQAYSRLNALQLWFCLDLEESPILPGASAAGFFLLLFCSICFGLNEWSKDGYSASVK